MENKLVLRNYQERQLKFINSFGSGIRALESPTGTGKSMVILKYIADKMNDGKDHRIVLATGFNELVWQIAKSAKDLFGLHPQIILGNGLIIPTCKESLDILKIENNDLNYSKDTKTRNFCTSKCPHKNDRYLPKDCAKHKVMNLMNQKSFFIITNHSYYICMKDYLAPDVLVIDEAHVFGDFYSSNSTAEFSKREKDLVNTFAATKNSMIVNIFKIAINNGNMTEKIVNNFVDEMAKKIEITASEGTDLKRKLYEMFKKVDYDSFIERTDDKEGNCKRSNFYVSYDLKAKKDNEEKAPDDVIITSATLDEYTLRMFNCLNRNLIYRERVPNNRFNGSKVVSVYDNFRDSFVEYYNSYCIRQKGLILCTTLENVEWTYKTLKAEGVPCFKNIESFRKDESSNKVLIGSKIFFQGIDIPELEFVVIDKIPFETYDDKFKAYSYYIEKVAKVNAWTNYTLPLVKNNILQMTGRLFRKNDIEKGIYDQGTILIFDPRLENKFKYLEAFVVEGKSGIKLIKNNLKGVSTRDR